MIFMFLFVFHWYRKYCTFLLRQLMCTDDVKPITLAVYYTLVWARHIPIISRLKSFIVAEIIIVCNTCYLINKAQTFLIVL